MAGVYIHIPFCKQACIYCAFHFSTLLKSKADLVDALCTEMELRKDYLPQKTGIDTLYFGGGTPSLLSPEELQKLIEKANDLFHLEDNAELTLEGNPDDLNIEKLRDLRSIGINRLSIGIQSFFDLHLQWMNRAHNAEEAISCVHNAYAAGFNNFSIDLIFGFPGLTDRQWRQNIDRVTAMDVPHVSCYALTREPKTVLDHYIKKKKVPPLDEEQAARQYEILMNKLDAAGYELYEISNFSKPSMRARHNSNYWKSIPYLGIGPGAHSFRPGERQWNVSNNALYIESINKKEVPFEKETLSSEMQWDEYIMTGLRTIEGCDLEYISTRFGEGDKQWLLEKSQSFQEIGQLQITGHHIAVTRKGRLFADGIAAALFKE